MGREALAATERYAVFLESEGWSALLSELEENATGPIRQELLRGTKKTREELAYAMGILEGVRRAVYTPYEVFAKLLAKELHDVMPETAKRMFE